MRRRSDTLKANLCQAQHAARSQNNRSAIASADSFDRYYRLGLSDYRFFCTIVLTVVKMHTNIDEFCRSG